MYRHHRAALCVVDGRSASSAGSQTSQIVRSARQRRRDTSGSSGTRSTHTSRRNPKLRDPWDTKRTLRWRAVRVVSTCNRYRSKNHLATRSGRPLGGDGARWRPLSMVTSVPVLALEVLSACCLTAPHVGLSRTQPLAFVPRQQVADPDGPVALGIQQRGRRHRRGLLGIHPPPWVMQRGQRHRREPPDCGPSGRASIGRLGWRKPASGAERSEAPRATASATVGQPPTPAPAAVARVRRPRPASRGPSRRRAAHGWPAARIEPGRTRPG